ncbi:MAG TPA: NAD(P)/FAD-dependent oxidoreductase [Burkholderiales bacterium]|nr:NAD(P)/FAD-dependent oxidoreductase [Burkholderiales bacterium]
MLNETDETLSWAVTRWLAEFEKALSASDDASLEALFRPDAHWRDLLAFTWQVKTVSGARKILDRLKLHGAGAGAAGFEIDRQRTPPRRVTRAGTSVIEAIFRFETACVRAHGVLRLIPESTRSEVYRAWTLLTALDEIKGFEESVGSRRPRGESYSRDFRGPNWLDRRKGAAAYEDRDPAVLVVGGGHAGLSIGARLRQLNVDALVVDRESRIGDNWRNRYHALTLHNQVQVNHLPYMPFPANWPTYVPKDKLAGWFEAYAESMELDFWTGTEFSGGSYDREAGRWTVVLRQASGSSRTLRPRHIVMATGVSGIPNLPDIPSLKNFDGQIVHSHDYRDAAQWNQRNVLVIGTGNSGHDIAQDLYSNGAKVTLVQRSPTLIVNIEPSAQLPYALYSEGTPLEDCDLITASMPLPLLRKSHRMMTEQARNLDKPLLDDLSRVGFKIDVEDETGWQFKYLQRGGGYYFNVGCSNLIVEGKIRLVQFSDIAGFVAGGARMSSGEVIRADLIVLATGYRGLEYLVRRLFGDGVADRVGPVWGIDEEQQELRNMWMRTGQPGLWFIAGSFAQCRIYSKYLALQIKAAEEGLIPVRIPRAGIVEDPAVASL